MPASLLCDFKAINCEDYQGSFLPILYELLGTGTVTILGGSATSAIDVGAAVAGVSLKSSVYIGGGAGVSALTNINAGHKQVRVDAPNSTIEGIARIGHLIVPRLSPQPLPTLGVHAGATGITIGNTLLSDLAGTIRVTNSSGSTSSTGTILDLTFGFAPLVYGAGHEHLVVVHLTPGWVSGSGWGSAADAAAAITAGIYWFVTDNSLSGFSVGIVNGLPNLGALTFSYQVVFLESN